MAVEYVESLVRVSVRFASVNFDLELEPEQPDEVAAALERLLPPPDEPAPSPWWRAGIEEALET
jgi:hypothetical protein